MSTEKRFAPTLKTFLILLVFVAGLGLLVWDTKYREDTVEPVTTAAENEIQVTRITDAEVDAAVEEIFRVDSDGDGLEDWEEALWGTDPLNPDSDNDSYSDTAEVIEAQNSSDLILEDISELLQNQKLSPSEELARSIYGTLANLSDTEIAEQKSFITDLVANDINNLVSAPTYTLSDLSVVPSNVDNIITYANQGAVITLNNVPTGNQVAYLNSLITAGEIDTPEVIGILTEMRINLGKIHEGFQVLSVPTELANEHLDALNATSNLLQVVTTLATDNIDPLVQYAAITQYQSGFEELGRSYLALAIKLETYPFLTQ